MFTDLGERYTINRGVAPEGYHHIYSFFGFNFKYPNTTQYEVYTKTKPVPRMNIASNERRGLAHRPEDRMGKGVEHSADDKHIGWRFEFSFYAFYDPKMEGTLESIVSDMYNPYRCKIDTEAPLGGWRRLFALYILPSSMFTMFEVTTGRAVPNQDVMISFHRISMKSHLEEQVDIHGRPVQFLPQHSFFAFDRPFPNTKKYMVHERVDLFGATRLSRGEAHKSNVVDEEEEKTIIWNEIYHFYCWYVYLPIHFYLPMK